MAEQSAAQQKESGDDGKKLYTLTEVADMAEVSMPTAQRYKKNYQDRIPSVGEGRSQRYPEEAVGVFEEIKKENVKRRGRPPKKKKDTGARPGKQAKTEKKSKGGDDDEELLTLTRIAELTNISYPTLSRYVKLHKDRIPFEGKGRKRRYHPEAVDVFKEIYADSPRGRKKKKAPKKAEKAAPKAAKAEKTTAEAPKPAPRERKTGVTGDGALARRVEALEKSSADLEKQIRELIKQLQKPLKVEIRR